MKLAAAKALAELAKKPVPDSVLKAYNIDKLEFGTEYIIPKPLDPRLLSYVASAVARAAIESGVAKHPVKDWDKYRQTLDKRLSDHIKMISRISGF